MSATSKPTEPETLPFTPQRRAALERIARGTHAGMRRDVLRALEDMRLVHCSRGGIVIVTAKGRRALAKGRAAR